MDRRLDDAEIATAFGPGRWAEAYPPVLNPVQAAKLAGVPVKTVYDWSSRGLLRDCACKTGKHLRIWRDRFIRFLFP